MHWWPSRKDWTQHTLIIFWSVLKSVSRRRALLLELAPYSILVRPDRKTRVFYGKREVLPFLVRLKVQLSEDFLICTSFHFLFVYSVDTKVTKTMSKAGTFCIVNYQHSEHQWLGSIVSYLFNADLKPSLTATICSSGYPLTSYARQALL